MIIKHRKAPASIAGYDALLKRLPPHHPKAPFVQKSLNQTRAGIGGERRLDEWMADFSPPYPYVLLQGVHLPQKCQVDTLLVTQSFILLMEVKNISGLTRFTHHPHSFHKVTADGEVLGMKSPITQVETVKLKVGQQLARWNVQLPVFTAVIVAYPNQLVESAPINANIWRAEEVLTRLSTFQLPPPLLSPDEMMRLGQKFCNLDREFTPFPLAPRYDIPLKDIDTGVFCPACSMQKMTRLNRSWICPLCQLQIRNLPDSIFDEWFMLVSPTITTDECRHFFELPSARAAYRLLLQKGCVRRGGRKLSYYERPDFG